VDDSKADGYLMREAIDKAGIQADLVIIRDGQAATQYFEMLDATEGSVCPDLILLDMNLPKKTGDEVLRHLRAGIRSKSSKVLIVSSSDSPQDRLAVEAMGVAGYFKKPSNYGDYMKLGPLVRDLLESEI
jgi:chemotaxis family two-component system response regulator Rcp1